MSGLSAADAQAAAELKRAIAREIHPSSAGSGASPRGDHDQASTPREDAPARRRFEDLGTRLVPMRAPAESVYPQPPAGGTNKRRRPVPNLFVSQPGGVGDSPSAEQVAPNPDEAADGAAAQQGAANGGREGEDGAEHVKNSSGSERTGTGNNGCKKGIFVAGEKEEFVRGRVDDHKQSDAEPSADEFLSSSRAQYNIVQKLRSSRGAPKVNGAAANPSANANVASECEVHDKKRSRSPSVEDVDRKGKKEAKKRKKQQEKEEKKKEKKEEKKKEKEQKKKMRERAGSKQDHTTSTMFASNMLPAAQSGDQAGAPGAAITFADLNAASGGEPGQVVAGAGGGEQMVVGGSSSSSSHQQPASASAMPEQEQDPRVQQHLVHQQQQAYNPYGTIVPMMGQMPPGAGAAPGQPHFMNPMGMKGPPPGGVMGAVGGAANKGGGKGIVPGQYVGQMPPGVGVHPGPYGMPPSGKQPGAPVGAPPGYNPMLAGAGQPSGKKGQNAKAFDPMKGPAGAVPGAAPYPPGAPGAGPPGYGAPPAGGKMYPPGTGGAPPPGAPPPQKGPLMGAPYGGAAPPGYPGAAPPGYQVPGPHQYPGGKPGVYHPGGAVGGKPPGGAAPPQTHMQQPYNNPMGTGAPGGQHQHQPQHAGPQVLAPPGALGTSSSSGAPPAPPQLPPEPQEPIRHAMSYSTSSSDSSSSSESEKDAAPGQEKTKKKKKKKSKGAPVPQAGGGVQQGAAGQHQQLPPAHGMGIMPGQQQYINPGQYPAQLPGHQQVAQHQQLYNSAPAPAPGTHHQQLQHQHPPNMGMGGYMNMPPQQGVGFGAPPAPAVLPVPSSFQPAAHPQLDPNVAGAQIPQTQGGTTPQNANKPEVLPPPSGMRFAASGNLSVLQIPEPRSGADPTQQQNPPEVGVGGPPAPAAHMNQNPPPNTLPPKTTHPDEPILPPAAPQVPLHQGATTTSPVLPPAPLYMPARAGGATAGEQGDLFRHMDPELVRQLQNEVLVKDGVVLHGRGLSPYDACVLAHKKLGERPIKGVVKKCFPSKRDPHNNAVQVGYGFVYSEALYPFFPDSDIYFKNPDEKAEFNAGDEIEFTFSVERLKNRCVANVIPAPPKLWGATVPTSITPRPEEKEGGAGVGMGGNNKTVDAGARLGGGYPAPSSAGATFIGDKDNYNAFKNAAAIAGGGPPVTVEFGGKTYSVREHFLYHGTIEEKKIDEKSSSGDEEKREEGAEPVLVLKADDFPDVDLCPEPAMLKSLFQDGTKQISFFLRKKSSGSTPSPVVTPDPAPDSSDVGGASEKEQAADADESSGKEKAKDHSNEDKNDSNGEREAGVEMDTTKATTKERNATSSADEDKDNSKKAAPARPQEHQPPDVDTSMTSVALFPYQAYNLHPRLFVFPHFPSSLKSGTGNTSSSASSAASTGSAGPHQQGQQKPPNPAHQYSSPKLMPVSSDSKQWFVECLRELTGGTHLQQERVDELLEKMALGENVAGALLGGKDGGKGGNKGAEKGKAFQVLYMLTTTKAYAITDSQRRQSKAWAKDTLGLTPLDGWAGKGPSFNGGAAANGNAAVVSPLMLPAGGGGGAAPAINVQNSTLGQKAKGPIPGGTAAAVSFSTTSTGGELGQQQFEFKGRIATWNKMRPHELGGEIECPESFKEFGRNVKIHQDNLGTVYSRRVKPGQSVWFNADINDDDGAACVVGVAFFPDVAPAAGGPAAPAAGATDHSSTTSTATHTLPLPPLVTNLPSGGDVFAQQGQGTSSHNKLQTPTSSGRTPGAAAGGNTNKGRGPRQAQALTFEDIGEVTAPTPPPSGSPSGSREQRDDKPAEAVGGFFPGVPGQPRARDRSPKTPIVFGDLYYQMGSGERGAALGGEANKNHKGEDDVLQCVDDIRDILGEGEVLVSSDDAANTSAREDGEAEDDTMGITTSLVLDPTSSTDHQRAAEQELDPSSSSFYHYNQQMNGVSKQQPRPWSKGSSTSNKGAGAMPKGKGVELAIDVGLAERGPGNPDRMLSGTGGGEFSVRNRISPSGSDVLPPPSRGHQHPQGGSGGGAGTFGSAFGSAAAAGGGVVVVPPPHSVSSASGRMSGRHSSRAGGSVNVLPPPSASSAASSDRGVGTGLGTGQPRSPTGGRGPTNTTANVLPPPPIGGSKERRSDPVPPASTNNTDGKNQNETSHPSPALNALLAQTMNFVENLDEQEREAGMHLDALVGLNLPVRPEDRDRGDEYDPFAESLEMEDVRGGEVEGGTGGNKS